MKILCMLLMLAASAPMAADSVWPGGQSNLGNHASLISDNRALGVGDLVTVDVVESATAEQSTNTESQKTGSVSGGAGLGSWNSNAQAGLPLQSYGAGAQESFNGGGTSTRSGKIVTTLSARVINVLESGNLVIEGRKAIKINDDRQTIFVRGVIRPQDVNRNNTVMSSDISDAQIVYSGKGPLSEKSSPGIFTRLLDWLGIF